jgi:hypothetical protein
MNTDPCAAGHMMKKLYLHKTPVGGNLSIKQGSKWDEKNIGNFTQQKKIRTKF